LIGSGGESCKIFIRRPRRNAFRRSLGSKNALAKSCNPHRSRSIGFRMFTVYASPDLPSGRRHQKAPLGASSGSHDKESRGRARHFQSGVGVQVRRARPEHDCALCFCRRDWCVSALGPVDGTGAFPHSGLRPAVAGPIFETKNRAIFLETFFGALRFPLVVFF